MPQEQRGIITALANGARRTVMTTEDGCCPIRGHAEFYRNLAERAKGAAFLSVVEGLWPDDLRARCCRAAIGYLREVAETYECRPGFHYDWQAAFWSAEAASAGWALWDQLDEGLRDRVAAMVIDQADRFIDAVPKMGYRGNTEAETVAWNSSILTLAVNMMPEHPHHAAWDRAAKTWLYNIFAVPADAESDEPADDGRGVRDWVAGANLYDDFALENHRQFHIDYVLCCFRFQLHAAVMYALAGREPPAALRHHLHDVYKRVLLPCMTSEGLFVYVSDNDWKRYHPDTESCTIHGLMAMLFGDPLAAHLESRAAGSVSDRWSSYPPGFAYDNPYVCGKPWTPRIGELVLLHLLWHERWPAPAMAGHELDGVQTLATPALQSVLGKADGCRRSFCLGRDGAAVMYVGSRQRTALLPSASNYQLMGGKGPLLRDARLIQRHGGDWFYTLRLEPGGAGDAFISLPQGGAMHLAWLPAAGVPDETLERRVAIEKPHRGLTICTAQGQGTWMHGDAGWYGPEGGPSRSLSDWACLPGDATFIALALAQQQSAIRVNLPPAGKRGDLVFLLPGGAGQPHASALLIMTGCKPDDRPAIAAAAKLYSQGPWVVVESSPWRVAVNFLQEAAKIDLGNGDEAIELPGKSVAAWKDGRQVV